MSDSKKIGYPVYLDVLHNFPGYLKGTAKRDVRKIKEIMQKFEYDDDFIESVNDDFCLERDTAKKPVQTEDGMVCPICGSKAVPWSRFCDECGQRWWEEA